MQRAPGGEVAMLRPASNSECTLLSILHLNFAAGKADA